MVNDSVTDSGVTAHIAPGDITAENVQMLPAYMAAPEYLLVEGYVGEIVGCRFVLAQYQDSDFTLAGITLPPQLQRAVAKRKAEYLAGRCLARLLLQKAGKADEQLVSGADRAPCWPAGICGAISHNHDQALCAVSSSPAVSGTGIDVENVLTAERAAKLAPSILGSHEMNWLINFSNTPSACTAFALPANSTGWQNASFALLLTLAFSAKESLFKAVYPHVKRYFTFHDAALCHIDTQQNRFHVVLMTTLNAMFPAGREFTGRYFYDGQTVITFLYF